MKNLFYALMLLLLSSVLFSIQSEIRPAEFQLFDITQQNEGHVSLRFEQPQCELNEISVSGEAAQLLTGENVSMIIDDGMPALPYYTTMLSVPATGGVTLRVNGYDIQTTAGVRIPAATGVDISGNQTRHASLNYKISGLYPANVAELSDPEVLRDERFVILTIYPYAYNPTTQELVTRSNIDVEVVTDGTEGINEIRGNHKRSRSFETLYSSLFINYERDEVEYQARSILIIHPDVTSAIDFAHNLGDWKRMKGFEVNYLNTDDLSYASNTNIKNYIQDAYDTWENPPEYLIIVGDTSGSLNVPTWTETYSGYQGCGDNPYATLVGGDLIPDAFVGRISVGSTDDLLTIWSKIVNYEIMPFTTDMGWYNHSAMISDTASSGISTYYTNEFVRESILWYDPDHTFTVVHQNSPNPSLLSNAYNEGCVVFSYRGIGELNGWDTTDINNLDNGLHLANTSIITCNTGTFNGSYESRTEALLRCGTSASPKGAISAIGMATNGTHTMFNNCLHGGIWYGLYMQGMNTMGEALVRGKVNLHKSYSGSFQTFVNSFSHWCNQMGDPSLDVWKATPKQFSLNYDSELPTGSNSIQIQAVDGSGSGVEDVWVTIRQTDASDNETLFATGYTDASGYVRLYFDPTADGTIDVTATKPQHIPVIESFNIGSSEMVGIYDLTIDDDNQNDSQGNGNGDPNSGETLELLPILMNYLGETAENITATLICEDPYVTVIDNQETFSNIESNGAGTCLDDFEIAIGLDCPDHHVIDLELNVATSLGNWQCHYELIVQGSDLDVIDYDISGNDVLDPGESADLSITLANNGNVDLTAVKARLTPLMAFVGVSDSTATFGDIAIGQSATCLTDKFTINAVSISVPGMTAKFQLDIWNEDGYSESEIISFTIGTKTITDPLGPDNYGYFCFDEGDVNYEEFPTYEWIEINPSDGGSGTNTGLSDAGENNDDVDSFDLPFNFKFYGEIYSSISISSNGWISFIETQMSTFRNWHVPGPLGPRAMVAAFWDDLMTYYGEGIYTWFNSNEHYYVIEWSECRNRYNSSYETFEIILYDPEYYPTSTGDGMIKIQYNDFNNVNQGSSSSYWPEHGNYCTVGLENHDSDDGLEYTYNNIYYPGAKTITDHSAILFTTRFAGAQDIFLRVSDVDVIDSNMDDLIDCGTQIEFYVGVENTGTQTASDVATVISSENQHVTILQGTSDYPEIVSGGVQNNAQPFVIKVDPYCPDDEEIEFGIEITCGEDVFEREFSFTCRAPEFSIESFNLIDASGDGMLEPGESGSFSMMVTNTGSLPGYTVEGLLACSDEYITINESGIEIELLAPNQSTELESCFQFTVSEDCPEINHFRVNVTLSDAIGVYSLSQYNFNVGFFDNVELGAGDWTHYVMNENYDMWGLNTSRCFSPVTSWKCGGPGPNDYYDDSLCALESPEMNITDNCCLTFRHWMEAESASSYPGFAYDGGFIQVLIDGVWTQIDPVGGYPYLSRGTSSQFDYETPFYSGNINWETAYFDLSGLGETVKFRFVFGTDVGTTYEGWYIDNIAITEMDAALLPPENLSAAYMGNQNIQLSWDESESEGTHYNIYRRSDLEQPYQLIESATGTTFTDDSPVPYHYNYYVVTRATDSSESAFGNTAQVYSGVLENPNNDVPVYVTALGQNFPNPFNPETIIPFSIKNTSLVTIDIYNIRGQRVKRLVSDRFDAGQHQIVWNSYNDAGKPVASGIYFSRMTADGKEQIRKMLLLK